MTYVTLSSLGNYHISHIYMPSYIRRMYQMLPITASFRADWFLALLKPVCKVPTTNFADSALNANTAFY